MDADTFRAVLGQWPSGVTVVTTVVDGVPHGMTASSFTSVSLDPPLVSVAIARHVSSHDLIAGSGVFAVNILGKDQVEHGKRFAGMLDLEDRFAGLDTTTAETGSPVLPDALGWLDCRVWAAYDGGDHTIFVGEVQAAGTEPDTAPLLYHARSWGQVADVLPGRVTLTVLDAAGPLPEGTARIAVPAAQLHTGARARGGHVIARAERTADIERVKVHGAAAIELACLAHTPDRLVKLAHDLALPVRCAVPATFGTPQAPASVEEVVAAAQQTLALGVDEVVLDDSGGGADPLTLREVLQRLGPAAGPTPIAFRAGSGPMALANVLTALKSGVRHLDVALADPTIASALDVVTMLDRMHVACGLTPDQVRALPAAA